MRMITKTTYHFQADGPGEAPDEGSARRQIKDITELLSIGLNGVAVTGPERRAVTAMIEGFTIEQYQAFKLIVAREIAARRTRHADAAANSPFSRAILRETDGIEAMAMRTFLEIDGLIPFAEKIQVTALEPNSAERIAAEAREPFGNRTIGIDEGRYSGSGSHGNADQA